MELPLPHPDRATNVLLPETPPPPSISCHAHTPLTRVTQSFRTVFFSPLFSGPTPPPSMVFFPHFLFRVPTPLDDDPPPSTFLLYFPPLYVRTDFPPYARPLRLPTNTLPAFSLFQFICSSPPPLLNSRISACSLRSFSYEQAEVVPFPLPSCYQITL